MRVLWDEIERIAAEGGADPAAAAQQLESRFATSGMTMTTFIDMLATERASRRAPNDRYAGVGRKRKADGQCA